MTLSSSLIMYQDGSQNSGKQVSYETASVLLPDETQEQVEEVHREGMWAGQVCGASMPSLRHHPSSTSMCSATWELSEPHSFGILTKPSWRHDGLMTQFLAPCSSLENGEWGAESSQFLIMAWSFW